MVDCKQYEPNFFSVKVVTPKTKIFFPNKKFHWFEKNIFTFSWFKENVENVKNVVLLQSHFKKDEQKTRNDRQNHVGHFGYSGYGWT